MPCVKPKLSLTKVWQTLSYLTLFPHQTKTVVPNWFIRRFFAILNWSVRFGTGGAASEPGLKRLLGQQEKHCVLGYWTGAFSSADAFPYSTMGDYFNAQTHFTQSVLKHGFLFCQHIGKNCEVDSFRQTMLLNALNPDNGCLCKNPWSFPKVSTDS